MINPFTNLSGPLEPALISSFCSVKWMSHWLPLDRTLIHHRLAPSRSWYSFYWPHKNGELHKLWQKRSHKCSTLGRARVWTWKLLWVMVFIEIIFQRFQPDTSQQNGCPSSTVDRMCFFVIHKTGLLTGCAKKVEILHDFGGKLCGTKSRLCGKLREIAQFCTKQNIWSPSPYQSKRWILLLEILIIRRNTCFE